MTFPEQIVRNPVASLAATCPRPPPLAFRNTRNLILAWDFRIDSRAADRSPCLFSYHGRECRRPSLHPGPGTNFRIWGEHANLLSTDSVFCLANVGYLPNCHGVYMVFDWSAVKCSLNICSTEPAAPKRACDMCSCKMSCNPGASLLEST